MLNKLRYIFSRKEKITLSFLLMLIIIGSFFELVGVAVFMPFISLIMNPETTMQESPILTLVYQQLHLSSTKGFLVVLAFAISVVYIVKNIYLSLMQNCILKFSYQMRMHLATKLLTTYLHEPYTFHLNHNIAELQRSLQSDSNQFMQLVNTFLQSLAEIMVMIVIGLYLFHTSHSITIVVMGLLVSCVGLFFVVSKKVSGRIGEQNQRYNTKLLQWINQALGGIKEVKVLQRETYFINNYEDNYRKLIKGAKTNEMLATLPKYIVETVCMVGMLMAVIIKLCYGQDVDIQTFVPQLSAFAVASFRMLPSVGKLNAYISTINYCLPSLNYIYNDLKGVDEYHGEDAYRQDALQNASFVSTLRILDIVYHYPDTNVNVINHVSLCIPKGKTVAFIGSSGAGKTTMADIILGLLNPQQGRIMVDEWDIRDNPTAWHRLLGYIPQTIYLTDDTIRHNIAFGLNDNEIDDEAVKRAIREAQLQDFVDELPEGSNSYVGDRGVRISGGQRQRIGIARALYRNPEILILDEATSALDNETENAVMDAIDKLQGTKTMIIIAHRLTTIRNADIIYEVSNGIIQERTKEEIGI